LDGSLAHRDSLGNGSILRRHELQRMTAGTGVQHSEFNASDHQPVHFLQIWIQPDRRNIKPRYAQQAFPRELSQGRLRMVVSPDGSDGSIAIAQDARMYSALLAPGDRVEHRLASGRRAWVQVARGAITLDGTPLQAGDGAAASDMDMLTLVGVEPAEVLLFDLP
jgi:redox-sensitive bicupin YhaK (pirin superfamily)